MRVLVTGAAGQVGRELMRARWPEGWSVRGCGRGELDVTAPGAAAALSRLRPEIVVNAAAYTAVDRAESEPEAAFAANRDAPAALARWCRTNGAALLHFSTDYVFDGSAATPYGEDTPVAPINLYGASKEAGETAIRSVLDAHVILRTSWVFGATGQNFVRAILRRHASGAALRVVADQQGRPTAAADLARVAVELASRAADGGAPWGTLHYAGAEPTSWHGFARAILDAAGDTETPIEPIATADYPTPARRPLFSVLDTARIERLGIAPRPWRADLPGIVAALRHELAGSPGFPSAA